MSQPEESRIPEAGEVLMLADGRRFVFSAVEDSLRGRWFTATAQDGTCTLQGNLHVFWDSEASTWRPEGARSTASTPPSMRRPSQPRQKQKD